MPRSLKAALGIALIAAGLFPGLLRAAWAPEGVPVCTAAGTQSNPVQVSDANGGVIIVWSDYRSGSSPHIYAQRLDAAGGPLWGLNGVLVGPATGAQQNPAAVSDGGGGAIVAWNEIRTGVTTLTDVYAQHLNSSGTPTWAANGIVICNRTGDDQRPVIISDNISSPFFSPGAIIAWDSHPLGGAPTEFNIYAQSVDDAGAIRWTANGVAVCTVTGNQIGPVLCPDGGTSAFFPRGVLLAWMDQRGPSPSDVYGQWLNSSGVPQLASNGIPLAGGSGTEDQPAIAFVAASTAIAAFRDNRNGNDDIYAQRLGSPGGWVANGLPVCRAAAAQTTPLVVTDGKGGVIAAWGDKRNSTADDIYAQRVNGSGASVWTLDGVALCGAAGMQNNPRIVVDSHGGAIVTWQDGRFGADRVIFAQHVDSLGVTSWTPDGTRVCVAAGDESQQVVTPDGGGGGFVAWTDRRNGNFDIYANRIDASGGVSAVPDAATHDLQGLWLAPNPTAGPLNVHFELPFAGAVSARAYAVTGQLVRQITADAPFPAGAQSLHWDGLDMARRPVAEGVYFIALETDAGRTVRKVSVLR